MKAISAALTTEAAAITIKTATAIIGKLTRVESYGESCNENATAW